MTAITPEEMAEWKTICIHGHPLHPKNSLKLIAAVESLTAELAATRELLDRCCDAPAKLEVCKQELAAARGEQAYRVCEHDDRWDGQRLERSCWRIERLCWANYGGPFSTAKIAEETAKQIGLDVKERAATNRVLYHKLKAAEQQLAASVPRSAVEALALEAEKWGFEDADYGRRVAFRFVAAKIRQLLTPEQKPDVSG